MSKRHPNRRQAAYQQLQATFPQVFPQDDAELQPLALSIRDEVSAWIHGQGVDERAVRAVRSAVQHHCSRQTYQQGVVAGGMRINLQGEPIEPVTPEGQAHAESRIAAMLASRAAKAAPPVPMQPESAEPAAKMPMVIVKKRRRVVLPSP